MIWVLKRHQEKIRKILKPSMILMIMMDTPIEDNTMPSAVFDVSCTVVYVEDDDLDNIANSPTFHKKITVKVSSNSMRDVMVISSIYSYWNFLP